MSDTKKPRKFDAAKTAPAQATVPEESAETEQKPEEKPGGRPYVTQTENVLSMLHRLDPNWEELYRAPALVKPEEKEARYVLISGALLDMFGYSPTRKHTGQLLTDPSFTAGALDGPAIFLFAETQPWGWLRLNSYEKIPPIDSLAGIRPERGLAVHVDGPERFILDNSQSVYRAVYLIRL